MTQGKLLYSTIFNVVVDVVLNHWVTMVAATEGTVEPGSYGFVWDIKCLVEYLYADDGLLELMRETWLQSLFGVLMELFDRVGMCTNMGKMVSMMSQPCCAIGGQSLDAYGLSMVGEGLIYWDRLCQRVRCPN